MKEQEELLAVLKEAKKFLALPANDFSWSSWEDMDAALQEIDHFIKIITEEHNPDIDDLTVLFTVAGPIQEVSLSSGWASPFADLADRFDVAFANYKNKVGPFNDNRNDEFQR